MKPKSALFALVRGAGVALFSLSLHGAIGAESAPAPLAFSDFYQHPVGPRGLEPGRRLLALAGTRVELRGFVARTHNAPSTVSILAPVPVLLDDEDEGLADDLPPAVAYLHAVDARVASLIAGCRGAMRVTGLLDLGRQAEADGRASFVRLRADDAHCVP